jgi:hypothetical protein
VISTRKNGYRVIGEVGVLAHDPFAADTQPMQGLAAKYESLPRVVSVKIDDQLRVERVGDPWVVSDRDGELGWCRWRTADDGRVNVVTDMVIRLPSIGTPRLVARRRAISQGEELAGGSRAGGKPDSSGSGLAVVSATAASPPGHDFKRDQCGQEGGAASGEDETKCRTGRAK